VKKRRKNDQPRFFLSLSWEQQDEEAPVSRSQSMADDDTRNIYKRTRENFVEGMCSPGEAIFQNKKSMMKEVKRKSSKQVEQESEGGGETYMTRRKKKERNQFKIPLSCFRLLT